MKGDYTSQLEHSLADTLSRLDAISPILGDLREEEEISLAAILSRLPQTVTHEAITGMAISLMPPRVPIVGYAVVGSLLRDMSLDGPLIKALKAYCLMLEAQAEWSGELLRRAGRDA